MGFQATLMMAIWYKRCAFWACPFPVWPHHLHGCCKPSYDLQGSILLPDKTLDRMARNGSNSETVPGLQMQDSTKGAKLPWDTMTMSWRLVWKHHRQNWITHIQFSKRVDFKYSFHKLCAFKGCTSALKQNQKQGRQSCEEVVRKLES